MSHRWRFACSLASQTLPLAVFALLVSGATAAQNAAPMTARQALNQRGAHQQVDRSATAVPGRNHETFGRGPLPADNVIYDNGPVNGTTDAWGISFPFVVANTFTISAGPTGIHSLSFAAWLS